MPFISSGRCLVACCRFVKEESRHGASAPVWEEASLLNVLFHDDASALVSSFGFII